MDPVKLSVDHDLNRFNSRERDRLINYMLSSGADNADVDDIIMEGG